MENGITDDIGIRLFNYFISDDFHLIMHTINKILIIYTIICIITLIPSLYMMYKKENIKSWYAFIPLYNLYYYFKIIHIPYYLVFIPIVNIITLYIANYRLAKEYNTAYYIRVLSFIIPFITTPYIVFCNKYNLTKKVDKRILKTLQDVDKVEERLINSNVDNTFDSINIEQEKPIDESYESDINQRINKIESNAITDDFYDDLLYMDSKESTKKDIQNDEVIDEIKEDMIDIQDIIDSNDIRVDGISSIENKIENNSQKVVIDNSNYQEYKEQEKNLSTIAFGGTKQSEKLDKYKTESKTVNKCPFCNSTLDINSKTCPGCGRDVSNIVFEK